MLRIVCFAEARADAKLGSALGDRVLTEEGPAWVEPELLPDLRRWSGLGPDDTFTKWTELKRIRSPRYIGHPTSGPRGSDYAMAYKALSQASLASLDQLDVLAVVLLRDRDTSEDARAGLRQAATEPRFAGLHVVVGIADKMRESWVLTGFDPCDAVESARLDALRAEIGFDPTREPERLRANSESEARHPKMALARLTGADPDREEWCWSEPPLAELRHRGRNCGLADYLDELSARLVPLI